MAQHSFVTQWDADSGVFQAEQPQPGGREGRSATSVRTRVEFRAEVSVSIAEGDQVCAIDVRELPQHVAAAMPQARDEETVGHAWLDTGWLWIPLSHRPPDTELTGVADLVLHFEQDVLAGLSLRFLEGEPTP
ncbi:hypothetical protein [Streptomyces resistomycificus]|uniref:hypothetical protein n=1 Tax=Streptomyces resistomycificus TaxID=67356 RepID=UPI000A7737CD|nr:hypothetical protein [Streptomyces resistomycificus]